MPSPRRKPARKFESLEPRLVLDSTVVFNEIMYHPTAGPDDLEWVELHNQMAVDMDLSSWSLTGGVDFRFPEATIVPGGGYLVVAADPAALGAAGGFLDALGPFIGQLSNGGEALQLRDRNDRLMDAVRYDDEGRWPVAPDGSGASLAKSDPDTASEPVENWTSSVVVGGTPGQRNFADADTPPEATNVVPLDSAWRFDASDNDLGTAWREPGFDDSAWASGPGAFFAGDGRIAGNTAEVITGVTAAPSSNLANFDRTATHVVDGSGLVGDTHVIAPDGNMWLNQGTFVGGPSDLDPEITFDLGAVYKVDQMRVWNYNETLPGRPELLGRGISSADVLVAGEDQVFSTLIANEPFAKAPGTQTDFSETLDFGGVSARYVKLDIHGNHGGDNNFVGLSEVRFTGLQDPTATEVPLGPTTTYFRHEFAFAGDAGLTELVLNSALDDGAVFYLNGVELHRQNMPDGPPAHTTLATASIDEAEFGAAVILPGTALVLGANVLAVEVHQAAAADMDMVFAADLTAIVSPPSADNLGTGLVINEVAAAGDPQFFVELSNNTSEPLDLAGYRLQTSSGANHVFSAQQLGAGQLLALTAGQLGFTPASGDRLFLFSPDGTQVSDGAAVGNALQARATDGAWLFPAAPTPGGVNQFDSSDEIVINEIMYHHRPDFAKPAVPAVFGDPTTIVPIDAEWNFDQSGDDLGTAWREVGFDDSAWSSGPALLFVESSTLPAPKNTPLTLGVTTYYFRTTFDLAAIDPAAAYQLRHVVDDGAVFYVNGQELDRFNLDDGEVTSSTPADGSVGNATFSEPLTIPSAMLVAGANTLAVEVHQRTQNSSDVVFGMELFVSEVITPGIPATEYAENREEWIELHNRADIPVDLSGWKLAEAVDYQFPFGTWIPEGGYLVVAKDPTALSAKYQGIEIVGGFTGSLSNETDRIVLTDNRGNPADVVQYYEDGYWPKFADGGGASLELRDPWSDNLAAQSWAASDEASRSTWQTVSFTGTAEASPVGPDGVWRELVIGLLTSGEILLDDFSVLEHGGRNDVEFVQNGSFESGSDAWRLLGNHRHSEVIVDPDDPGNHVLRLVATGATEHMHNHLETTFADNRSVVNGRDYTVSFRAKWIGGTSQLNTRLYFNRLARTTIVDQPPLHGTPGQQNSTFIDNAGPTYRGFTHDPAVPDPSQPVTVTVFADDPDGIASTTLWYSVVGRGWMSMAMAAAENGAMSAVIPGQAAGAVVQFYVEGEDGLGAISTFPAAGRDSRALFKVEDGLADTGGLHNLRIIMTPDDATFLHTDVNLMSNDRVGATIIYNESEVFYDANVRLSGSQRARPFQPRLSFNVGFNSHQLFRGVHRTLAIDRSESTGFGQREILIHHAMNHAGGLPGEYNDLIQVIPPRLEHTGPAELQMARYNDVFLGSQYENGEDGLLFEYELIYFPTTTNSQGLKRPQPDTVAGTAIRDLGDDKEAYRWNFLVKNNRRQDEFEPLMEFARVMGLSGTAFRNQVGDVIDVDQWLRAFAIAVLSGAGDSYGGDGAQHNAQFYMRPEDGKFLYFPHDLDAFFNATRPIAASGDLNQLIADMGYRHDYYGHLHDIITTTYNGDYMAHWTDNFGGLLPAQNFAGHLSFIAQRANFVLGQLNSLAPQVDFEITTNAGQPFSVDDVVANIEGNGWINVREIRLAGSDVPLELTWTDLDSWQATVPVTFGSNALVLEAYDFQGNLIASDSITVTSTVMERPLVEFLRVTELMFHPADPTAAEVAAGFTDDDDFEFLELTNIGNSPLDISAARFTAGINFDFAGSAVTMLNSGEHVLMARDTSAFAFRYGADLPLAGQYTGRLDNAGERLRLEDATGATILDFAYDDAWYPVTDGHGYSLVIVDALADATTWSQRDSWRASALVGGSPGSVDPDPLPGDTNGDGRVDVDDLNAVRNHFGAVGSPIAGDANGDGRVDVDDLNAVRNNFGSSIVATPAGLVTTEAVVGMPAPTLRGSAANLRLSSRRSLWRSSRGHLPASVTQHSLWDTAIVQLLNDDPPVRRRGEHAADDGK